MTEARQPGSRPAIRTAWTPHPGQREILESDSRFRVVACGRRWGKTEMCAHEAIRYLGEPETLVWWVAPTYDIADIGFDTVEKALPDVVVDSVKRTKPKAIDLVNGARISFRSADRPDSLRGEGLDLLIVDESAMVPERAWSAELRPTLSDTLGEMIAISTPNGRNWFHEWWQRGNSPDHPDIEAWRASTYENPHVEDSEVDAAKTELPTRVWEQEYLAEFKDESGGVFTGLDAVFTDGDPADLAADSVAPYVTGVDFARHQDWTVILTLDARGRLVEFRRLQQTSWPTIQAEVEDAGSHGGIVAVDASRDNKIVSDLAEAGLLVEPVKFSPKRKRELIENLTTRLEAGELTLPDVPQLRHELEIFEYDVTPSGNVRYNAPEGFTDDCVDALALAADYLDRLDAARRRDQDGEDSSGVTYL